MNTSNEATLEAARRDTYQIRRFLDGEVNDWDVHLELGRNVTEKLDATDIFERPEAHTEQIWFLESLQRLAYFDPDDGGAQDIAEWCVTRWLQMLQRDPSDVSALGGLGHAWLLRAQRSLARIHHSEGSSSSGVSIGTAISSHNHQPNQTYTYTSLDDAQDNARAIQESDARLHGADYVEARGILLPSTEYFTRAIQTASRRGLVTGDLLSSAAEAFMSLGNVSYSTINVDYFRQALRYLRWAEGLDGYHLGPYLQQYLEEYGKLIDE